jgi:hypothetical protein
VSVTARVGTKTVTWDFTAATLPGLALFSLENTSSGTTVQLLNYSVCDLGTTDTPTLRAVPVGQLYGPDVADTSRLNVNSMPMNSTYGALSTSACLCYSDVGFIPYGVPEQAIADSSGGSPKGMNYLHTRDFLGPMYRNMLAEVAHIKGAGIPDTFGYSFSHKGSDLLGRRAGITLNPGEGIALVNSAETAVGVQAAFGAWPCLSFAAQLDNEPYLVPTISVTGMVIGSRWRVERVSDGALIATGVTADGTASYSYTTEDTPLNLRLKVRNATSAPYYKPLEVTFTLTSAGASIPVSQIPDA